MKSWDQPNIAGFKWFIIKRPDAYEPFKNGELPKAGSVVSIDGSDHTVRRASYSGDSEFKYYPHIVIETETPA